jgi:RNA polymerase primary sigma factor
MKQLKTKKPVINKESASLEKYLKEIYREKPVTATEEILLAKKIQKGDKKSLEKLIKANLKFVVSVAKEYHNQGLNMLDLINEGNLGLMKAAERYVPVKGFRFISYAVWWIRQSIFQALAEQASIIHLPANKAGSLNKLNKNFLQLEQHFEREPFPEELSETPEISIAGKKITKKPSGKKTPVLSELNPFSNEEANNNLLDILVNHDSPEVDGMLIRESLRKEIENSLANLNKLVKTYLENTLPETPGVPNKNHTGDKPSLLDDILGNGKKSKATRPKASKK